MDAGVVIADFNWAVHNLRQVMPVPEQLVHLTDKNSEYRATNCRALQTQQEIVCSKSAKGCCWENVVVENFFSTL